MQTLKRIAALALVTALAACGEQSSAPTDIESVHPSFKNDGISGRSGAPGHGLCSDCHDKDTGAADPTVSLSGPTNLGPGETQTYTLTIVPGSGSNQSHGALNVAVPDGGTLIAGTGTQIEAGEIVHSQPKPGSGSLSWSFQWQAPAGGGTYTMYAVGLSTDGSGTKGDEEGTDVLAITVQAGNSPPSANSKQIDIDMNTATPIVLSGSDTETCELTFDIVGGPSHGSLSGISDQTCSGGSDQAQIDYTPATDYTGPDQFTYSVTDADGASSEATVDITVLDPSAVNYDLVRVRARTTKETKLEAAFILKNNGNRQQGPASVELYVDDPQGTRDPACKMMAADEPGRGSTAFYFSPATGCDVPLDTKGAPAEFQITIQVKDDSPDTQTETVRIRRITKLRGVMSAIERALRGGG